MPEVLLPQFEGFVPLTTPATSAHAAGTLVDKYGRHITYILSLIHISEPTRPY